MAAIDNSTVLTKTRATIFDIEAQLKIPL